MTTIGPEYSNSFTDVNRDLLKSLDLYDVDFTLIDKGPRVEITWSQFTLNPFGGGCAENYFVSKYKGSCGKEVVLFTADKNGNPPESFNSGGHSQNGAQLHFIMSVDNGCIAFVLHSNSWGPFQKRFIDAINSNPDARQLLHDTGGSWLRWLSSKGVGQAGAVAGAAAGAAAGASAGSVIPGLGTVVGAGVGAAAGWAVSNRGDAWIGMYCRYIG